MPRSGSRWKRSLLLAVVISFIAGCAGSDKLSPADVEAQAFEDLRNEIREAIDDPARVVKAIALVDYLADDLESLRETITTRNQRVRQLNADYETTRADTRDTVKTVMVGDDRRKEALNTLNAMKKRTDSRNKQVERALKDLRKTLGNDDLDEADIDAIWNEYFAEIDQYDHDTLNLRFELREHISREEWQEIFSGD